MWKSRANQKLRLSWSNYSRRHLSLVSYNNRNIVVALSDLESPVTFNNVFLRDACDSPESVDISTRQKLFTTAHIGRQLSIVGEPKVVEDEGEKALEVVWKHHDGSTRTSKYLESFLKKSSTLNSRMKGKFFFDEKELWTLKEIGASLDSLHVDYQQYLAQEPVFKQVVNNLNRFGISFINNIEDPLENPETQVLTADNSPQWPVAKMACRFGYVKPTFYGQLFDVKNEKNAKNIANTNVFLPLHMDLCYYESPPGLQLLHFIQNSTLGGENVFSDSFAAAKYVYNTDREAYEALKQVPLTFHYDNNGEYYYYMRPLIVEDNYMNKVDGAPHIKEVNYSPPFQGPLELTVNDEDPQLFDDFMRGMVMFEDFVNDPKNQYIQKTPENSCVVFDNRRVLHSRLEFSDSNGGDRWLMGCYVDGDAYRSKLRTLNRAKK
ncbi:CIC11C00000004609 [Sungouiella intermedia]|uniref:CIC11C00000004609 n=1 Tax=Sungouiella intermedia TaxID=45354 RepID=A0A1L0FSK7_9ASCO|nr:CIC11C00000004609 [[Candida] intermedia]